MEFLKVFWFLLLHFYFKTLALEQTKSLFLSSNISTIAEWMENDVIMKEVTSLSGHPRVRTYCPLHCLKLDACRGLLSNTNRCILIGHSSLPGDDVTMNETETMEVMRKECQYAFNGSCLTLITEPKLNWTNAEQYCVNTYAGHLVKIDSAQKNDEISTTFDVRIGTQHIYVLAKYVVSKIHYVIHIERWIEWFSLQ